jgi:hypothetical protein
MMAGAAALAPSVSVVGAVAELSGPSSDPCRQAREIADDARPADGKADSGIEREQAVEPAGDWLDAAHECFERGGDPGPGF